MFRADCSLIGMSYAACTHWGVVLHVSCRPPATHCFCFGRSLGGSLACFVPTARLACLMVPVAIGGWGSLAGLRADCFGVASLAEKVACEPLDEPGPFSVHCVLTKPLGLP